MLQDVITKTRTLNILQIAALASGSISLISLRTVSCLTMTSVLPLSCLCTSFHDLYLCLHVHGQHVVCVVDMIGLPVMQPH